MNEINLVLWEIRIVFWVSVLFPIVAAAYWPWWKTDWGRNLVSFDLSVALTIFPEWMSSTFNVHVSRSPGWLWVEIVGIFLVIVNILWRTVMIYRIQRKGTRHESTPRVRRSIPSDDEA